MMIQSKSLFLLAFDVDGVLTDGSLYYGPQGEAYKCFSARDGMGISLARLAGFKTAIITGRLSDMVKQRAADLGIDYIYQGVENKLIALQALCRQIGIEVSQVAYMGDDINDMAVLKACQYSGAPADACKEVRKIASWVSIYPGGKGAVREWIEYLLRQEKRWERVLQQYEDYRSDVRQ